MILFRKFARNGASHFGASTEFRFMITLDWTILAAGAVFVFVLWSLNVVLFRPLLAVLDSRKALTSSTEDHAAEQIHYQERLFLEYSNRLKQEKQLGYQKAEAVRREALAVRQQRITEAREKAEGLLEKAKDQVLSEITSVKASLRRDAEETAGLITARILEEN